MKRLDRARVGREIELLRVTSWEVVGCCQGVKLLKVQWKFDEKWDKTLPQEPIYDFRQGPI